jgi:hypothetical protein
MPHIWLQARAGVKLHAAPFVRLQVRDSLERDEQLAVLVAGFRGSNLDESDFASDGVTMRLVTDSQDEGLDAALPLEYDPESINRCAKAQDRYAACKCM